MEAALAHAIEDAVAALAAAPRVWVAYSGGLDSTVLLHAVHTHTALPLQAVHINHALQPEADAWEAQCRQQCAALGVPLVVHTARVEECGDGPEAAARAARYACFENLLGEKEVLLMAQHADDQAETLLLRLLRGAGPDGLAAMPPRRPLGRGELLRPFLRLERAVLRHYAQANALQWIDDASNADTRYDRNYLRHAVLPLLEQRWPGYRQTFGRAAELLRRRSERVAPPAPPLCHSPLGDPGFALADLPEDRHAAADAVRAWLAERALAMPPARRLEEFLQQLSGDGGAQLGTRHWVLERYRERVYVYLPAPAPPARDLDVAIGDTLELPGIGRVTLRRREGGGAPAAARWELRFRRGGERLRCPDGSHLSLKTLYQGLAIPPWWRARVPLLYGDGELLAVGPLRSAALPAADAVALDWEPPLPDA